MGTEAYEVAGQERARIDKLARRVLAGEPALSSSTVFGPLVKSGLSTAPKLLIGDQSEIPLLASAEETSLGYRIAWLAADNDMIALAQERCRPFETYLRDLLGLTRLDILELATTDRHARQPLALRCRTRPELFSRVVARAAAAGALCIVPHLTSGHAWRLAQDVAAASNVPVSVCGPPPRLSRRINDKLWFAARVREVLGGTSLPATFSAYGPAALAAHVLHLARRYERVVVKVPDSAGSAGNLLLESARLREMPLERLRTHLMHLLAAIGWRNTYPLMIEVWDTNVLASPSVQIWVPATSDRSPIIEGVFEQIVEGPEGSFVGAVKARLPDKWRDRLVEEASRLALLFQRLGYFGRCSLDAVICEGNSAGLHWIECNGRWGGVSLPMTLLNRVVRDPADKHVAIVQRKEVDMQSLPFEQVLERLGKRLFIPGRSHEGVIVLSPTGFERGAGMHFMAVGESGERVKALARETQLEFAPTGEVALSGS